MDLHWFSISILIQHMEVLLAHQTALFKNMEVHLEGFWLCLAICIQRITELERLLDRA